MSHPTDFPTPTLVQLDGVELEVFEAGRESGGRPIVLCHGWPDHAFTWRHLMPELAAAGYHVIAPNQRGYGRSSCPSEVTAYDIGHLSGDLVALLDHYGYEDATFIGHDWGSSVVWGLAQLHPERVDKVINLSVPYFERGDIPWGTFMEAVLGPDYYMVHFNQKPGVADAVFEANTHQFLRNMYRKNVPPSEPRPGMEFIELARDETPRGEPLMSEADLGVLVSSFEETGFTGSVDWYRNLDRNWHLLAEVDPIVGHPALMIYGDRDTVAQSERLAEFVPQVEVVHLDCGHWMHLEMPAEVNQVILGWLGERAAT